MHLGNGTSRRVTLCWLLPSELQSAVKNQPPIILEYEEKPDFVVKVSRDDGATSDDVKLLYFSIGEIIVKVPTMILSPRGNTILPTLNLPDTYLNFLSKGFQDVLNALKFCGTRAYFIVK